MRRIVVFVVSLALLVPLVYLGVRGEDGQSEDVRPSVAKLTEGLERQDGLLPFYWDAGKGTVWLEIERFGEELLYQSSLPAGVGSNDIGLDRGKLGSRKLVRFERSGPRVLMIESNLGFRADSNNAAERKAVRDSFAESVVFGFEVAAEQGERVLVDAGKFFLRDAFGVVDVLRGTEQGDFSLDTDRSAFYLPSTRNFPRNTEVEVTLTFQGKKPGRYVRDVTPTPQSITVRQRHSFIALPDDDYQRLPFDPGSGYYSISYLDYASPVDRNIEKRFICRHRLEREGADGVVEPIVYYVDGAAPEPIRSALVEGAAWWNQAFEAAGYRDAYRVEILPADVDPMDARYNVIQWVHRATRGWSYGNSIVDPRTGEIIKGHVSLGSLRVRQDFLIAEALLAPYADGQDRSSEALEMALARIRQLSAHEVGHTLGLVHNFAASTAGRASVMDYPHPLVRVAGGGVDLSDAYDVGIGEWDKVAIRFAYDDRLDEAGRRDLLVETRERGIPFITDSDARPLGGAHPEAHLWDNGVDAVAEFDRVLDVRAGMLRNFTRGGVLRPDTPPALLEEALVPAYLFHRYQAEAAVKLLAGVRYGYGTDASALPRIVDPGKQRDALHSLLQSLRAETLALPESILQVLPPRPPGHPADRELFPRRTGLTFDPLAAAESAAAMIVGMILHPERAARLVEHHARDAGNPSLEEVIETVLRRTWFRTERSQGVHDEVERVVDLVVLTHLMELAESTRASHRTRSTVRVWIDWMDEELERFAERTENRSQVSHFAYAAELIRRYRLDADDRPRPAAHVDPPPGSPIGSASGEVPVWSIDYAAGADACGHGCGLDPWSGASMR